MFAACLSLLVGSSAYVLPPPPPPLPRRPEACIRFHGPRAPCPGELSDQPSSSLNFVDQSIASMPFTDVQAYLHNVDQHKWCIENFNEAFDVVNHNYARAACTECFDILVEYLLKRDLIHADVKDRVRPIQREELVCLCKGCTPGSEYWSDATLRYNQDFYLRDNLDSKCVLQCHDSYNQALLQTYNELDVFPTNSTLPMVDDDGAVEEKKMLILLGAVLALIFFLLGVYLYSQRTNGVGTTRGFTQLEYGETHSDDSGMQKFVKMRREQEN